MARADKPPAVFQILVRVVEPLEGGREMKVAHDLLAAFGPVTPSSFAEAKSYVDALLGDPAIPSADLKGLLNRCLGPAWGIEFEFGADAKAARRYLQALSRAIARELK